ncbi:MAG TPA: TetR family transcriptional regulator, partial [Ilumatobacteraceae bacterium]|nr:TetR family transcriptional regulator [Ilumatobacteraceae bacterium]
VADAAGISRRGLYLHFPSRAQLCMALVGHIDAILGLAESVRPMAEATSALAMLDAWAEHVAGYHSRLVAIVRVMDRSRHDDPDVAAPWDAAMAVWHESCRSITDRLGTEGHLD